MDVAEKIEQMKMILRRHNYSLTTQREQIARALLKHKSPRPSAEEVHHHLKKSSSKIARATVYRTLELFAELNIVLKINFDESVTRFCIRADECSHMDHYLLCANCGNLEAIKEDWLLETEQLLESEYGFTVHDHHLIFKGIYKTGLKTDTACRSRIPCSCNNNE